MIGLNRKTRNYRLRLLHSVLLCCTLMIMLVLPQSLTASHSVLTQVQQQNEHSKSHDHQELADDISMEHEHSLLSLDHSHESVDVFDVGSFAIKSYSCPYAADQPACLNLFIPVPEHPPRV